MFPGRWPNNPDSMWNSGWSMPSTTPHQTFVPHAQFCGGDPSYQQCQAQTQAQIQALQQKNALLNQQLYNQSMTHINHLQPLIPHQQTPQPSTIPTPPIHPTPPTPQSQPEPPTVTSPSPPPTPPAFNPEEMINQMKMTFKEGLAAAVEIANERHSQHSSQPTPPTSHNDSHLPPTSNQLHNTTQFPRRSRPLHRSKELAKTDKRAISTPRSPRRRPRSSPPSTRQRRDYSPQKGRDSSVTLRSVSPNGWSSSYDLDREDRTRYRSQGHSSRPAEPDPPQWHQQERSSTYADPSHRHSHHQDSSTWPEWDNYVGQMGQSTIHGKSPIVAQSTNIPFQFISPPILARTTLPSTLTCSSPVRSSIYKHKTTHCILFVLKTPQDLETPSSEPGYHSRGSSTIPEGHIQISLQDDHKHIWIKSGSSLA